MPAASGRARAREPRSLPRCMGFAKDYRYAQLLTAMPTQARCARSHIQNHSSEPSPSRRVAPGSLTRKALAALPRGAGREADGRTDGGRLEADVLLPLARAEVLHARRLLRAPRWLCRKTRRRIHRPFLLPSSSFSINQFRFTLSSSRCLPSCSRAVPRSLWKTKGLLAAQNAAASACPWSRILQLR